MILTHIKNRIVYSDKSGVLGMVNHYGGEITLYVLPPYRRQGIGTILLKAAIKRWGIDLSGQVYTKDGWAFIKKFRKKHDPTKTIQVVPNLRSRHRTPSISVDGKRA